MKFKYTKFKGTHFECELKVDNAQKAVERIAFDCPDHEQWRLLGLIIDSLPEVKQAAILREFGFEPVTDMGKTS